MHVSFEIPDDILHSLLDGVELPRMMQVRQTFDTPPAIENVEAAVLGAIRAEAASLRGVRGRVAVGVGSRGIGRLPEIVAATVAGLRELGCDPFIVPSMGSHGGATAEGQRDVLAHLGVTSERVGAPIESDMATVIVGRTENGMDVHIDRAAMRADAIVFVARIKPHTAYHGTYESGLAKMIAIGLGKQVGAAATHARGFGEMGRMVPAMARVALDRAPIRMAIAVLENAHDEPYQIMAVPADRIMAEEPALLLQAKAAMPRIPFDTFDVLVIDRIGKNISGDGADPNITGRYPTPFAHGKPDANKHVILDLYEASGGNANGIGTADFTTVRAANKMLLGATYPNALTSTVARPVSIPMILPSDRLALSAAVLTCNAVGRPPAMVRIIDTLHLQDFWISEALVPQVTDMDSLEVVGEPTEWHFDGDGNIC
jgi:hypothetical protein